MNFDVFTLRIKPQLKEAIRDRAQIENRTQTDLIREAVKLYLLQPRRLRRAEARQVRLGARNRSAAANKNRSTISTAKKVI